MLGKLCTLTVSFVVIIIAYVYYTNFNLIPSPVVTIKDGSLQGVVSVSRDGREFYEYLGIPYAKPPVGARRFEAPEPNEPWQGVRDASNYQDRCLQFENFIFGVLIGSEDCLYLNIFVPKMDIKRKPLPVMVYIHGGLFHVGSGEIGGPKYFMDRDVILVSLNYRLGALGFMSTGDNSIRGNQGLKDQNMALQWVQANIDKFGGDKDKVTIFGESAGGASVHHHVLSPKSKGLFWRAIHQSGTSINYWAIFRNVKEQSRRFAQKFDCPLENTKEMALCFKNLDARTLVGGHQETKNFFRTQMATFVPSIETVKDSEAFITEEPLEVLKSGRFNKVPIMTGCNSDEGLLVSAVIRANQTKLNEANDDWDTWAPRVLHYREDLKEVTSKLRKFYFGDEKTPINNTKYFKNYTNLFGDRLFIIPASQAARIQSKYVPTYLYYYDYQGELSIGNFMTLTQGRFHFVVNVIVHVIQKLFHRHILDEELPHIGTSHGDEIGMLLSVRYVDRFLLKTKGDYEMSKELVKLWSDFAKAEKPLKFKNIEWPALTQESVKYLRISINPALIDEPFQDRRHFWESINIPAN